MPHVQLELELQRLEQLSEINWPINSPRAPNNTLRPIHLIGKFAKLNSNHAVVISIICIVFQVSVKFLVTVMSKRGKQ